MKRFLPIVFLLVFFALLFSQKTIFATNVSGAVGEFYLNLSGYVSPYASVVLYTDNTFVRSTVADPNGNFYISQVLIKRGFSGFCLEAVDLKRLGDSYTCFTIPPAEGSVTKDKIFLPPTLGLSRKEIGPGGSADAFGYTMPGARVLLHLSNGRLLEATADSSGYYLIKISNLSPGNYTLFASATYNGVNSEKPSKTLSLRSLSEAQKVGQSLWQILISILTRLFNLLMTYIWVVVPVIILLIILLIKPVKDKLKYHYKIHTGPGEGEQKGLHHAWFIGY